MLGISLGFKSLIKRHPGLFLSSRFHCARGQGRKNGHGTDFGWQLSYQLQFLTHSPLRSTAQCAFLSKMSERGRHGIGPGPEVPKLEPFGSPNSTSRAGLVMYPVRVMLPPRLERQGGLRRCEVSSACTNNTGCQPAQPMSPHCIAMMIQLQYDGILQ
jgi:hypothetical protein